MLSYDFYQFAYSYSSYVYIGSFWQTCTIERYFLFVCQLKPSFLNEILVKRRFFKMYLPLPCSTALSIYAAKWSPQKPNCTKIPCNWSVLFPIICAICDILKRVTLSYHFTFSIFFPRLVTVETLLLLASRVLRTRFIYWELFVLRSADLTFTK